MSAATQLQALLRFLAQDAKIPLAVAIGKAKDLQSAKLDSPEALAKVKPDAVRTIFEDEKVAKGVIAAAKRVSKKRAAGDDGNPAGPSPKKKRGKEGPKLFGDEPLPPADLEKSLTLPSSEASEDELKDVVLFTNRAPLVLAFLVVLLKYTMPEQPLSGRLSLAQGYVSITSKSRAIYLGIENGTSAEDEGFGEGQPTVVVGGKEIRVIRRWGYEWKDEDGETKSSEKAAQAADAAGEAGVEEEKPALWALDLEALKRSGTDKQPAAVSHVGNHSNLPIYTPQSARAYLLKSFDTPATDGAPSKKIAVAVKTVEKEQNLGKLLRALDLLYQSWAETLTPTELDNRTWGWYVKVRPAVADGVAGWGGKNELKLADILDLRRGT